MYITSSSLPCKKAFDTSNCLIGQPFDRAKETTNLIVGCFTTGEKVSKKSIPTAWWNPLATKRALCLVILPSKLVLSL